MVATMEETIIAPHKGPQERFLKSSADIAIYGGAAGGGKSYALLLEPLRHANVPGFNSVTFRRTSPEITNAGGLWDGSMEIYPLVGGKPNVSSLSYKFANYVRLGFGHVEYEADLTRWHGSQICMLGFDELTTFTEHQFFYLMSRNRSACGVKPYVRATCNPDAGSWVAKLIAWWIDQASGYPIQERSGVKRWLVRDGDELVWADTPGELKEKFPLLIPKSLTFIPAKLEDNPTLMKNDPSYMANLMALPRIERERLLGGNWRISEDSIISESWLRYFGENGTILQVLTHEQERTHEVIDDRQCTRFATIDTAGTGKDKADQRKGKEPSYSCVAVWDYWRERDLLFLRHVWREMADWPTLKQKASQTLESWNVRKTLIENAHVGPPLINELKAFGTQGVGPMLPGMTEGWRGAKLERAIASGLLTRMENGRFLVPVEHKSWLQDYLGELLGWTGHPDEPADQIDVTSYAAHHCRKNVQKWGGVI